MIHVGLRVADLLVVLAALPGASPVSAQAQHGSITGTVTDDSGAVVAGASVIARRVVTGVEFGVESSGAGDFVLADLPPGDYEIRVVSTGSSPTVRRLTLQPGETRRIPLRLCVGGLTEDGVVVAGEIAGSHERLRRLPGPWTSSPGRPSNAAG